MNISHAARVPVLSLCAGLALVVGVSSQAAEPRPLGRTIVTEMPAPIDTRRGYVTRTTVVSFADLNLMRQEGADTLYVRLKAASRDVCQPEARRDPGQRLQYRQCQSGALDRAVAELGHPLVIREHLARVGRSPLVEARIAALGD
jgi:UrcA family protein